MINIPLTQQRKGTEIWVNMDNVTIFIPSENGTILRLNGANPTSVEVREKLEEVSRLIAKATKEQRSIRD